jgi:hypothetical protein
VSLRAKRSNLVVNHFKHNGIASSLTLLAMTDKEAFFNSLLNLLVKNRSTCQVNIMIRWFCMDVSEVSRVNLRPYNVVGFIVATAVFIALLLVALPCAAQDGKVTTATTSTADAPRWAYSATGMYYSFRNQDDFTLAVATAERGPLHIEARYNYEAIDSGSLFAGWKFSGGKKLTWEVTPILGAVFGSMEGIAPGFEAAAAYGIADFYIEAEYVRDLEVKEDSFYYSWSELGFTPWEWLRFGLVGQRTKVYKSDRDIQRGLFAQVIYRKATLGVYIFNPDDGDTRFTVFSLGAEF